ncbi:MAG: hypothetical protein Q8P46_00325 [Hyphomicrobiales bacterium]|nr:hypothetical protein [Hyphomicrobiales bacterium]
MSEMVTMYAGLWIDDDPVTLPNDRLPVQVRVDPLGFTVLSEVSFEVKEPGSGTIHLYAERDASHDIASLYCGQFIGNETAAVGPEAG